MRDISNFSWEFLDKLLRLLYSLLSSASRVIVHLGSNDAAHKQSELTKTDFNVFNFLSNCGMSVYISGTIPTLAHVAGHFSRILSLDTWRQSTCTAHNICFIDNFNLILGLFLPRSPPKQIGLTNASR